MKGEKKTRPGEATPGAGRGETAACGRAAISYLDSTTSGPQRQRVFPLLGYGKENAVPGHELAALLGLGDLRELTRIVERERAAGIPVCATCDSQQPGYYVSQEPGELAAYIRSLDRRLRNVRRTRDRLADTLEKITGQGRLF